MRKPKNSFRKLSNKKCIDCGQPLKQNLLDINPDAKKCWICYNIANPNPGRDMTKFKDKQNKLKAKYLQL